MSNAATSKQNMYYAGMPRSLCAPSSGFTISARLMFGLFSSAPGEKGETGSKKTFSATHSEIKGQIGCSDSTISRSMRCFIDADFITRKGMSTYEFDQGKIEDNKKWSFPLDITTRVFKMTDDEGNVFERKLTKGDCATYSYIYTKLSSTSYKTSIEASDDEIAAEVGIDPSTVSVALKRLRFAKLIYYPKSNVGRNGSRKSRISIRRGWSWFRDEKEYRARLNNRTRKDTTKKPENSPVTRELYYGELQAAAEVKAAQAREEARAYENYRELDDKIASLNLMYRRTLFKDVVQAQELSEQIKGLSVQRSAVLENIGISEAQLKPEYYHVCKNCKDTGWLPDGKPCGCFRPRGAPPGKGAKSCVGESNKKN